MRAVYEYNISHGQTRRRRKSFANSIDAARLRRQQQYSRYLSGYICQTSSLMLLPIHPAVDQQPSLRSGRKCRRALPCKRKFMDTIFLNKIFLNYVKQTYFRAGIKKNRIRDSGQKSNARLCELAPSASPRVHNLAGTEVRLSSLVTHRDGRVRSRSRSRSHTYRSSSRASSRSISHRRRRSRGSRYDYDDERSRSYDRHRRSRHWSSRRSSSRRTRYRTRSRSVSYRSRRGEDEHRQGRRHDRRHDRHREEDENSESSENSRLRRSRSSSFLSRHTPSPPTTPLHVAATGTIDVDLINDNSDKMNNEAHTRGEIYIVSKHNLSSLYSMQDVSRVNLLCDLLYTQMCK
ncbi:unnamed protein product [Trichogramma brassicae]|uniref:Uncharacterized protein n=1 Tax=Trichogramma brassicae TaxID=86971 RepID=A0A6H5IVZ1_9HYME|nr:unnamed protein product [Trichogramma brassicae]